VAKNRNIAAALGGIEEFEASVAAKSEAAITYQKNIVNVSMRRSASASTCSWQWHEKHQSMKHQRSNGARSGIGSGSALSIKA